MQRRSHELGLKSRWASVHLQLAIDPTRSLRQICRPIFAMLADTDDVFTPCGMKRARRRSNGTASEDERPGSMQRVQVCLKYCGLRFGARSTPGSGSSDVCGGQWAAGTPCFTARFVSVFACDCHLQEPQFDDEGSPRDRAALPVFQSVLPAHCPGAPRKPRACQNDFNVSDCEGLCRPEGALMPDWVT